ncbi:MAG: hypothetical protein R2867_45700 [Caldilineaceae bacterium]
MKDTVATYFGMRTVSRASGATTITDHILLNGEPVYLRGAIDQAFHEGLHAYPSDEIIRGDIQQPEISASTCCAVTSSSTYVTTTGPINWVCSSSMTFHCADLDTPEMRRTMETTVPAAVARDYNSPSIIAWIIFNET